MAFVNWLYKYKNLPIIREGAVEVDQPGLQYEAALRAGKILVDEGEKCPFNVIVGGIEFRVAKSDTIELWVREEERT